MMAAVFKTKKFNINYCCSQPKEIVSFREATPESEFFLCDCIPHFANSLEIYSDNRTVAGQAEKEKSTSSNDEAKSVGKKSKTREKKEVNSWDCSTPTNNGKISRRKTNDWESSSECQETMVEPFDNNEIPKDCDNWDSESDSEKKKNNVTVDKVARNCSLTVADSYELSIGNFSSTDKSTSEDVASEREKIPEEDRLFLEDFEEFLKDDNERKSSKVEELGHSPGSSVLGTGKEKVRSKQSEGTPEDTTIWMIPKTERTQSGESTSKLISSSDKVKIEKLNEFKKVFKKSKSLSDVEKTKRRRSSRSEYLGSQKNNYNNFLLCEGSDLQRKLEVHNRKESIPGCESFDRTRVFFTEYECRTVITDKDTPEKMFATSTTEFRGADETLPEYVQGASNESPSQNPANRSGTETIEESLSEMVRPGPSGINSLDVISLPDMTGKNSIKERQKEKNWLNQDAERVEQKTHNEPSKRLTPLGESWLLLDETGHYQAITKNEVSILLNGRSAEAVLQGRKQHFISHLSLKDTASLKNSLSSMLAKESLNFLREEDMGGEDDRKNTLELERKMENTLFYIQPGMNLTASIRIIPLETEMINLWRRTKDGGSVLSSEVDLLNPSQDSVETVNQRNTIEPQSSIMHLPHVGNVLKDLHECQSPKPSTINGALDLTFSPIHVNESAEYRKLLFETRNIVDSLTNNFQTLQSRLEGETNRSLALQVEVNKLRVLLKKHGWKFQDINSRETIVDTRTSLPPSLSILTVDSSDKPETKSENAAEDTSEDFEDAKTSHPFTMQERKAAADRMRCLTAQNDSSELVREENDIITVNIYTVESLAPMPNIGGKPQEMYSIVHSNLKMIENKMKRLQHENDCMLKQNRELKKKLKEISLELERYMASTSEQDAGNEENRESETPRDQVCNLKLELENLKTLMGEQRQQLVEENSLISEQFTKSMISLKEWCSMANTAFQKMQMSKSKLQESGITVDINLDPDSIQDPKSFQNLLICYIEKTTQCLVTVKIENFLLGKSVKDDAEKECSKEISGLDQVISGYSELIDQCRKGQVNGEAETKVMEDYFTVIMEKASLVEEVKILKTENEMLLESQLQHYEKLKQTMIALKDRKNEITALETSQKLSEEERSKMSEVLKVYEEERKKMEKEIAEKSRIIDTLMEEKRRKDLEFSESKEKLKVALSEIENFEKSSKVKDELISKLKMENNELLTAEEVKNNQIEMLKDEIKNLEMQGNQLEAELFSSKNFLSESHKEMKDYITHLEALVNSSQESIDKMKQKLKENNQIINRLKSENEILEKQHQCDLKVLNNTKDELNSCREKLLKVHGKLEEAEEEREKLNKKCDVLTVSEKEKSEALEILSKEFKSVFDENVQLREKVEIFSKDKDETLKEQKDLINKYSLLSKEIQKLQEKYRSVKYECNQRTDLIGCLEVMLKENLVEYNNRIACLERNISRIIEKIVACKNGMRDKHFGVDPEVRELRHQLDVTYQERKKLEGVVNNYHTLMKRLEDEIQQRENKVDELHVQLTKEQQKAMEYENERKSFLIPEAPKNSDLVKVEQLENQIAGMESELAECRRELHLCQSNYENEKKKLELTIADLKSEVKRYQLRIEVIMKNLSSCNKNLNGSPLDKRNADDSETQILKKELQEKNKVIAELNETIVNFKAEVKLKDSNLENFNKKNSYHEEELKNLQNQIAKMRESTNMLQQKEKDEMAEKLFQSMKLVMEERSSRQALESVVVEKEKHFKDQIDKIKNELLLKVREYETVSAALEDRKKLVNKLQEDVKKLKAEVVSLRRQVDSYKKKCQQGKGDDGRMEEDYSLNRSKTQNVSSERLESCLRELKEVRDLNLQLRKAEGQYQSKIVLLEDEIRGARLLIKELQGDIKTEKKSKKALKNMILAAKMEIEKCLMAKQLISVVAEKISRHLDLSEIPSRELLSGFRSSESSNPSKLYA